MTALGIPVRYDAIWEFGFLQELVGRNKVILQADFDALVKSDDEVSVSLAIFLDSRVVVCRM